MIKLRPNELEAANRAESSALLMRLGFRVYRPEADVDGEDLIVRIPGGPLVAVQAKSRITVHPKKYGKHSLWMLFPEGPFKPGRTWYLLPHDDLFEMVNATFKVNHQEGWSAAKVSKKLVAGLHKSRVIVENADHFLHLSGVKPPKSG